MIGFMGRIKKITGMQKVIDLVIDFPKNLKCKIIEKNQTKLNKWFKSKQNKNRIKAVKEEKIKQEL